MKTKIKLAGIAAAVLFCAIGIVTAVVLVYRVPAFAVLLVLGFYAIYENLAHRARLRTILGRRIGNAWRASAKTGNGPTATDETALEKSSVLSGRWYENPQLEALMDLGLTSDQARAELARQARYGVE